MTDREIICPDCSGSGKKNVLIYEPCPHLNNNQLIPPIPPPVYSPCPKCNGTGKYPIVVKITCGTCGGKGKVVY